MTNSSRSRRASSHLASSLNLQDEVFEVAKETTEIAIQLDQVSMAGRVMKSLYVSIMFLLARWIERLE